MRLKQICNHPAQFLQDNSAFTGERSHKLSRDDLRTTRDKLFLSFGSCSFTEPVDEARALGFIR